ncbi:hypothetical protein SK128_014472, partial [Halocaridina rubra]
MLEMLKDLCEGGDDVLGELAPLSELLAGGVVLVVDISGVRLFLRASPIPPAVVGDLLPVPNGEGDLLPAPTTGLLWA